MNEKKVLLIDEEPMLHDLIQRIFDQYALNINVISAMSSREGFEIIEHENLDLILSETLSLKKHGMAISLKKHSVIKKQALFSRIGGLECADGFDICETIKTYPQTSEIPFVFLTTQSMPDLKNYGIEVGAEDYITKPLLNGMDYFVKRVEELSDGKMRKYESLHVMEKDGMSLVIGEFRQKEKQMLDCVWAENGRLIKCLAFPYSQKLANDLIASGAASFELKKPYLYNCFEKIRDGSCLYERLPTREFLEVIATKEEFFIMPGYRPSKNLLRSFELN